jgi:hypothetical protein
MTLPQDALQRNKKPRLSAGSVVEGYSLLAAFVLRASWVGQGFTPCRRKTARHKALPYPHRNAAARLPVAENRLASCLEQVKCLQLREGFADEFRIQQSISI